MKEINNSNGSRLGVVGLLQVAFIVLKLCGIIEWSWVWVLAPAWIGLILYILAVILVIALQ